MTQAIPMPTPASRPITPRARRRSWAEMHVRPWVLLTVLFLIAAMGMGAARLRNVTRERRVIESGPAVTAKIVQLGISQQHQAQREESIYVVLEYTPPGAGQSIKSSGYLPRKPGSTLRRGGDLPVKIDPDEPTYFTDNVEPTPFTAELGVPLLLGAVSLVCFVIAWLARRRVLQTFASGQLRQAVVTSVRQTPAAPMSKQIGFTLSGGDDARVYACFWPNNRGPLAVGQTIDVIVPTSPTRSLAAAAYDAKE